MSRFDKVGTAADLAGSPHRIEDTGDNVPRTCAVHLVHGPGFEELRVRQDDPQLIVQPMEQQAHVRVYGEGLATLVLATGTVYIHAC